MGSKKKSKIKRSPKKTSSSKGKKSFSPHAQQKSQDSSNQIEKWLRQAFHLAAQKNLDAGEYFSSACELIQALPGSTLLNLYITPLLLSTKKPSFSLLGFSQGNASVLQRELNSFPFRQEAHVPFNWEERQVFKPFPLEKAPFTIYGFQDEKISPFKPDINTSVFYQPLWHQARPLGALSIVFENRSYLHGELVKKLQVCSFIFYLSTFREAVWLFPRFSYKAGKRNRKKQHRNKGKACFV